MLYINLIVGAFLLSMCQLTLGQWRKSNEWDHFMFAQAWPPGTCADAPRAHHSCYVAMKVETWTTHGLWPSLGDTKGPTSCNDTWKFDITKIDNLRSDLETYWPNLYNDTPPTSFWEHEWSKHGTCCTDLPTTSGEEKFFQTALMLNKKYNILTMLKQSGVVPSETAQYSYEDFVGAIKNVTGFEPVIQCTAMKLKNGTTYHLIDQIQICLNKDLTPRSCDIFSNPIKFSDTKLKDHFSSIDFEKGALIGRHHHDILSQSSCPLKYNFNYPPIHQNLTYN